MPKLEMIFDYICPFCRRGYAHLEELLPNYPDLEVEWIPCEANPRPAEGSHSDLCSKALFFALEQEVDLHEFHSRMYRAIHTDRVAYEDPNAIADIADGLLDREALLAALSNEAYEDRLTENNRLAWEVYDLNALPSFRMNGELLKAKLRIGVSKEDLAAFIDAHS